MIPLMVAAVAASMSFVLTYAVMKYEIRKEILAEDVHKAGRPKIPRLGGISLLIVFTVLSFIAFALSYTKVGAYLASIVVAGLLGLIDDFHDIDAKLKVIVFMIPALIPILASVYVPFPYVPSIGTLRLTIVYPFLIIVAYTISCNALNMADTQNGTAPTASIVILVSLFVSLFLGGPKPPSQGIILLAVVLAAILAYMPFNMYPAKVFNGNVGSFLMGAALISSALMLRREFVFIMLMIPLILNSFSILTSIGGLINRRKIKARPVYLGNDLKIYPSNEPGAPVTLVQLLTLRGGLSEKELVIAYTLLLVINAVLSLALYYALNIV